MAISVIITNFNGACFLPRLLESLAQQRGVETEIIVVDRNSSDDSSKILATYANVVVIQEAPETGMVGGYTAGIRLAKHEHLFFCNEDMWFEPDCLRLLEAKIDLKKRICAVDPWQWSYDGKHWIHGGTRVRINILAVCLPLPFYYFDSTINLNSGDKVPVPCVGAFLIHKDVFKELGGWDTSFFMEQEDIDLFIRAWQKDWLCGTVPEAKVYHAVGASNTYRLKNSKQTVKTRRYISSRTNTIIIALKYFSFFYIPITFIGWMAMLINHALRLRLQSFIWDILALTQVFKRLPVALRFRFGNSEWNRHKPGQKFFTDPEFLIK